MNLKPGSRILKAVDGEDRRRAISLRPYAPQKHWPTPATRKAKNEKKHREVEGDALWKEGVSLLALPSEQTTESAQCYKYLIEISGGIDYYILMVFLDNHSGGFHGTGHAGAFIIDGKSRKGTYTDFGPYGEVIKEIFVPMMYGKREKITQINKLGEARIKPQNSIVLKAEHGELDEEALAYVFSDINKIYGSKIVSREPCLLGAFGKGPAHENFRFKATKAGFYINGIVLGPPILCPQEPISACWNMLHALSKKWPFCESALRMGIVCPSTV